MLRRTVVALLLLSIAIPLILIGGIPYFLFLGFFILVASLEYLHLFRAMGAQPSPLIVVGGTLALIGARFFAPKADEATLTLLILLALTVHLIAFERGRASAATDFAASLGGFIYLGWVGGYLLEMRQLPNGEWWVLFVLPCVWVADSFAYIVGSRIGKHKMTPHLSPNKSWEGYVAGFLMSTLIGGVLANSYVAIELSVVQGALFGLALGLLPTLGDLGESMIKRQAGIKDSGTFLPGHGGAFDRIDSLLWAAAFGVLWIRWFLL